MSVYLRGDSGHGDASQTIDVGRFQCGGVIVVCDPCYRSSENLIARFANAKSGPWQASIRVVDFGPVVGQRVERLLVSHVAHRATVGPWLDADRAVAVDTGRVAACDGRDDLSKADEIPTMAVAWSRGVLVKSGFGDGVYPCRFREIAGEVVAIEVRFIDGDDLVSAAGGAQ